MGAGWLCLQTSAPGWAAPARQGLTWKQRGAPAPLIPLHSICGGDGPAESCASLHPSFPPACGLAEGWGGRGGASSSSISAPSLCDLGPVLT